MNIIFVKGISGSGKSTYVKKFLEENPDYVCINRDALRLALVKDASVTYYARKDLGYLEQTINAMIEPIIKKHDKIIVDNTNLKEKYINDILKICRKYHLNVSHSIEEIHCADPTIAMERVALRDYGKSFNDLPSELQDSINTYITKQYLQMYPYTIQI